jgi:hypothetical protein
LDPVVAGSQLTRVLIDGGSGLNLLFVSTLKKMGLDISKMLTPSKALFYSIVPGNVATPIGAGLDDKLELELINFFRANRDIFAWKPANMPGCPRT